MRSWGEQIPDLSAEDWAVAVVLVLVVLASIVSMAAQGG